MEADNVKEDYSSDATEPYYNERFLKTNQFMAADNVTEDYSSDATEPYDNDCYLKANQFTAADNGMIDSGKRNEDDEAASIAALVKLRKDTTETTPTSKQVTWSNVDTTDNVHPYVHMCRAIRKRKEEMTARSDTKERRETEALLHAEIHPRSSIDLYLQLAKKMRHDTKERRETETVNAEIHPRSSVDLYLQLAKKMRHDTKERRETEAVHAEIQVEARSSADLYQQLAKNMRLRKHGYGKESVMTGDLQDLHNSYLIAQADKIYQNE